MLHLEKWQSNPPGVMAKIFVSQCCVTLEKHNIHLWMMCCIRKAVDLRVMCNSEHMNPLVRGYVPKDATLVKK